MALLPPGFMDAVVALGVMGPDGTFRGTATGFLYGNPTGELDESGESLFSIFLVTNRHVIEGVEELASRFNQSMSTESRMYPIPLRDPDNSIRWTVHPDPNCDVAVIPINAKLLGEDGIHYKWFRGDDQHTLSIEQAREIQISEGDGVFVLGFPLGLSGEECNYTIVRQGNIARIRDWLYGNSQTFLIDASVFPGNSGGPVILRPAVTAINGTTANKRAYLIGMVSSYIPYEDVATSRQTGRPRITFVENSGLGVVVPMNVIQETVSLAIEKANYKKLSVQSEESPKEALESVEQSPAQVKSAARKPLGQWLVDNVPRGTDFEIPSREEPGRPNAFLEEEER